MLSWSRTVLFGESTASVPDSDPPLADVTSLAPVIQLLCSLMFVSLFWVRWICNMLQIMCG